MILSETLLSQAKRLISDYSNRRLIARATTDAFPVPPRRISGLLPQRHNIRIRSLRIEQATVSSLVYKLQRSMRSIVCPLVIQRIDAAVDLLPFTGRTAFSELGRVDDSSYGCGLVEHLCDLWPVERFCNAQCHGGIVVDYVEGKDLRALCTAHALHGAVLRSPAHDDGLHFALFAHQLGEDSAG